jgi:hypothetical protein
MSAQQSGDRDAEDSAARRIVGLVTDTDPDAAVRWLGGGALMGVGRFEEALPLMQVYVEHRNRTGRDTDWVWLLQYAACLWKATGQTSEAAVLLQLAAEQRRRRSDGQPEFTALPAWRTYGLGDMPQFVAAIA